MLAYFKTWLKAKLGSRDLGVKANRLLLAGCALITLYTTASLSPAYAQLFNSPVDQLPVTERVTLRRGQPVVVGEKGKYVAKVLVSASKEVAWSVVTDYDSFAKFLPHVVSSQVLRTQGNQKIVEQVSVRRVFLTTVRSHQRLAVTEVGNYRINFSLIEGDHLQKLQGYWQVEPVSPYAGATPNQVLITQEVETQPSSGTPEGIFYSIFKDSLSDNLSAIRQEINRRMGAKPG